MRRIIVSGHEARPAPLALLGPPTESNSINLLGVSGTSSRWVGRDAVISVQFVNGKVALKSFDKPGVPGK